MMRMGGGGKWGGGGGSMGINEVLPYGLRIKSATIQMPVRGG